MIFPKGVLLFFKLPDGLKFQLSEIKVKNKSDEKLIQSKPKDKAKGIVVPIDLPGQPIQCWIGDTEKITVILRKHRDFIIDINLLNGKTYTVWSEQSEMYDTRTKTLIHSKEKILFNDGEILHLWIGRNFKGKIYLFDGIKQIGAYSVENLDPSVENFDATFKPAPITVVMKNDPILPVSQTFNVMQTDGGFSSPKTSQLQEAEKFLQVVELKWENGNAPKDIADFFAKGGEKEIVISGGVITRNWIMNQVSAQCGYFSDNKNWIKELWDEKITLRNVDHPSGRRAYVILTGSTRIRRLITAARYGVTNAKVLAFSFGAGSAAGLRHSAWSAAGGNFKGAGLYSMLFTISLDIAEWSADYEQRDPITGKPKQDIGDLFAKIGVDIAKNTMNSIITSCIMWGILTVVGGAPVVVVIIGTIVVSFLVNWAVDAIDKKSAASEKLVYAIKNGPGMLEEKLRSDYDGYVKSLIYSLKKKGMIYDFDSTPIR